MGTAYEFATGQRLGSADFKSGLLGLTKALARLTTQIPCGRLGRPEEVARIIHVLAADASSYITGQVWSVNGGWTCR